MSSLLPTRYPVDLTGTSLNNLVMGEPHTLSLKKNRSVAPLHAPYFKNSLQIVDAVTLLPLTTTQYQCFGLVALPSAIAGLGHEVYSLIVITDPTVSGSVQITYQTVGGGYTQSYEATKLMIETLLSDNRPASWSNILGKPDGFEPSLHLHAVGDAIGWEYLVVALEDLRNVMLLGDEAGRVEVLKYIDAQINMLNASIEQKTGPTSLLGLHQNDTNNPHYVTKEQIGLGDVQNYPLATDAEAAAGVSTTRYMTPSLVTKALAARFNNGNPYSVTKEQIGLGNVQNYSVATVQDLKSPDAGNIKYVTNLVLRDYLLEYLTTYSNSLMAEILTAKTNASNALAVANANAMTIGLALDNTTDAVVKSTDALALATQAKDTVLLGNQSPEAAELLARSLMATYVADNSAAVEQEVEAARLDWYASGEDAGYVKGLAVNAQAGALLNTHCAGTSKIGTYADGDGGTYDYGIALNSTDCGYVPPELPTYQLDITNGSVAVGEGSGLTFVVTTDAPDNSKAYWRLRDYEHYTESSPAYGTFTQDDIISPGTTGEATIVNGTALFSIYVKNDGVSEANERFVVELFRDSTYSGVSVYAGPVVATRGPITINAQTGTVTDITPTSMTIRSSATTVSENGTLTFNVTAPDAADGTELYYVIEGTSVTAADFTDNALAGAVTITNGRGVFTKTLSNDVTTEGSESFEVILKTDSISGTSVASTSSYPGQAYVAAGDGVPEQVYIAPSTDPIVITDTSLTAGTPLPASGTLLSTGCSGTTQVGTYANGTGGTYTATIAANSAQCGYIPPAPVVDGYAITSNESFVYEGNSGISFAIYPPSDVAAGVTLYWLVVPYGSAGVITASDIYSPGMSGSVVTRTATFSGGLTDILANFTLFFLNDQIVENTEKFVIEVYTDAQRTNKVTTSSEVSVYNTNSALSVPGALVTTYCSGSTKVGSYIDGTGGFYTETIERDSVECGYAAAPATISYTRSGDGTVEEGTNAVITVTTTNVPNSTSLHYVISDVNGDGINAADFGIPLTGNFTHNNNLSVITIPIAMNDVPNGTTRPWYIREQSELFGFKVDGGNLPYSYGISMRIKQPLSEQEQFTLVPDKTTVVEGQSVTIAVKSVNTITNDIFYWKIVSGNNLTAVDFGGNILTGTVKMGGTNTDYITIPVIEDMGVEANGSFVVEIRSDPSSTVLATSPLITVTDAA